MLPAGTCGELRRPSGPYWKWSRIWGEAKVKSGDGTSTSPLPDLGEHAGEGALGRVERAVGEVGPGAFLGHQGRQCRIHPPERQLQVFFERRPGGAPWPRRVRGRAPWPRAGPSPRRRADAKAEDQPDRPRVVSWRPSDGEHVALASDRQHDPRAARVVAELLAEPGNVHVDRPGGDPRRVQAPDPGQQLVARDGPPGVAGEVVKQLPLALRELAALAVVEADLVPLEVGLAPVEGEPQDGRRPRRASASGRPRSGRAAP